MTAYLFDLDGTLIDSREDIAHSANAVREVLGLKPRHLEEIYEFIGEGVQRLLERTLGDAPGTDLGRAVEQWRVEYSARLLDNTRPFDGILEALGQLDGPKAVVTNKPGDFARRLVDALGMGPFFPVVLGPDDVFARKPDPQMIQNALGRLGVPAEHAILIGDSGIDAQTALNAGVRFVGVTWGLRPKEEMERLGARVFATAPHELAAACEAALRQPRATVPVS